MKTFLFLISVLLLLGCSLQREGTSQTPEHQHSVVEGTYPLSDEWQVTLPGKFNKRIEEGSLVIWRPGFTIWTAVWGNDKGETPQERLKWISAESSSNGFDKQTETDEGIVRYAYRLDEDLPDSRQPAFYCFAIGKNGHVQMAIYFDNAADLETAEEIWRSVAEVGAADE